MNNTLYVDIDSTIWSAQSAYDKAALELYGKPFGSHWYDIPELISTFGPDYKRIFRYALDPRRIPDRELYEGVPWALHVLRGQGFHIHFISHNDHDLKEHIKTWLDEQLFGMPFDITVHPVEEMDKVDFMSYDPNAWGIIEDKAETLQSAIDFKYNVLCRKQPWNTLTLEQNPDIMGFDDWGVVPALVLGARKEVLV